PTVIIALAVTLSVQTLRALFPLLVFRPGVSPQALAIYLIAVFLSPLLTPILVRVLGAGRTAFPALAALALFRFALQLFPSNDWNLFLATGSLVMALISAPFGIKLLQEADSITVYKAASAIVLGLAVDSVLNATFFTWDYAWHRDVTSLILAFALSGL